MHSQFTESYLIFTPIVSTQPTSNQNVFAGRIKIATSHMLSLMCPQEESYGAGKHSRFQRLSIRTRLVPSCCDTAPVEAGRPVDHSLTQDGQG